MADQPRMLLLSYRNLRSFSVAIRAEILARSLTPITTVTMSDVARKNRARARKPVAEVRPLAALKI